MKSDLDGAPEERRGDASPAPVSEDQEVVAPARFPAQSGAGSPFEQKESLAPSADSFETPRVVRRHPGADVPRGAAEKVPAVLGDGGPHVGERTDVGDGDRARAGSREVAGGSKRSAGLRGEIDAGENPDSGTSQARPPRRTLG